MSNNSDTVASNMIDIIKDICKQLGYVKDTKDNIITKCIYCGDSPNKYTGHFYIWKHFPVAFCFRCNYGTSISLLKWASDLQPIIGEDLVSKLKESIKSNYILKSEDNSFTTFVTKDTFKTDINSSTGISFSNALNLFENELNRRNITDYHILLEYIKHSVINISLYEDLIHNYNFVGVRSIFGSGYHLRNLVTNQTLQKRLAKNDVFLVGCSYTPRHLYVVEGLYDAISVFLNLTNNRENIYTSSFLISSVGYFTSDCYKYMLNHIPEHIVIIYDRDVDDRIISTHLSMYKYLRRLTKTSVHKVNKYKDISEALSMEKNSNVFDHLRTVM